MLSTSTVEEQRLLKSEPLAARHQQPRSAGNAVAAIALVALGVVLGVVLAPASSGQALINVKAMTIFDHLLNGTCPIPDNWCNESAEREDKLSFRDCDGDGIVDPYCEGGELLRFGYISSKHDCHDNWPSGLCERPKPRARGRGASTANRAASNEITIVHFNDVYEVSGLLVGNHRTGGMSRAFKVVEQERARNPDRTFVVFAGDLLSPSTLSTIFKGKHMIDILNTFKLDAASLGNHEFDFGLETLSERMNESKFPWLNINIEDDKGNLLPHTTKHLVKEIPWAPRYEPDSKNNSKVCFFGAAYDVRMSLSKDIERMGFKEIIPASLEEAEHLRTVEKCDVVIALTHQLEQEDCELSKKLGDKVDLILGGHDHSTAFVSVCGHAPYAKAASDLTTQWIMTLWMDDDGTVESVDGRIISLTDADPFNMEMHDKIVEWEEMAEKDLGINIGCLKGDLETSAEVVRTQETNSGNWWCDAMREAFATEVAVMNSGGIHGNKVFQAGDVSKQTLMDLSPYSDTIVKIYATGKQLKHFLSRGLNCMQDPCGDFNQVSGLRLEIDSTKPKGHRLLKVMTEDGNDIDEKKEYTVAINEWQLGISALKKNRLYQMVTRNDAQPLMPALIDAVEKAGDSCIEPKVDGRIKDVSKQ